MEEWRGSLEFVGAASRPSHLHWQERQRYWRRTAGVAVAGLPDPHPHFQWPIQGSRSHSVLKEKSLVIKLSKIDCMIVSQSSTFVHS